MSHNAFCPIDHIEIAGGISGDKVLDDGSVAAGLPKKPAGVIKILDPGDGTMTVVYANGRVRAYSDLTVGEEVLGNFKQINDTGTGVTKIRISWLA